ncbi:hypothetical protein [Shewanella sp. KJ2020]|uniref:hypothetical protein n=1 Tax=Shewanella sp. KJ2020 TaxID=2919172 RepID=UPI0020A72002|nr:hypothetical protein [Shewanella sp. KJ2020]MCP3129474.1 hypothetical protein [Shewanella sp. KJ2020]
MKILVVFILIVVGVFLFRRAQRLAKEEQAARMSKEAADKSVAEVTSIDSTVEVVANDEVKQSVIKQTEPLNVTTVEAELLPRESQEQINHTEITEDIIDVDMPAAHNKDAVIILGEAPAEPEVLTSAAATEPVIPESVIPASTQPMDIATPGSWGNITLQRAFEEYQQATSVLERYTALQNIIAECYKQRKSADYLNYGAQLAQPYLLLFRNACAEQGKDVELKTSGFLHLATLLNDTQAFDAAIALCREALTLGLSDGTVTGFEGRISRIEKAQAKATTA